VAQEADGWERPQATNSWFVFLMRRAEAVRLTHTDRVQILQPEPLPHPCERLPHLYPHRKYEHGDAPGMRDSEEESEYFREKAQNCGQEPGITPGWAKHLRLKLRIAQHGHLRAIAPSSLDVAGLQASGITLAVKNLARWHGV